MRPVAKCQSLPSRLRRIPKQRGRQLMTRSDEETPVASQRRPGPCGSGTKGANQKSRNPAPFIWASILIGDQRGQCMECSTYPQNCGHTFNSVNAGEIMHREPPDLAKICGAPRPAPRPPVAGAGFRPPRSQRSLIWTEITSSKAHSRPSRSGVDAPVDISMVRAQTGNGPHARNTAKTVI
jgi:hypothetical protein